MYTARTSAARVYEEVPTEVTELKNIITELKNILDEGSTTDWLKQKKCLVIKKTGQWNTKRATKRKKKLKK